MLTLNQEPPISVEYFLDNCRYTLSEHDYKTLLTASITPEPAAEYPALVKWQNWERTLRNVLASMRSQKTGIDDEKYLREGDSATGVFDAAREASTAANPKIAEGILDSARWQYLDEIEGLHNFDLTKLVVYYLKLQILERRKKMNLKDGEISYRKIYESITDKIHQSYDGEL